MSRTTLTKAEAKVFADWLEANEWKALPLNSEYEKYRLRKDDKLVILYSRKGKDNLTVPAGIAQDMMMEWLEIIPNKGTSL